MPATMSAVVRWRSASYVSRCPLAIGVFAGAGTNRYLLRHLHEFGNGAELLQAVADAKNDHLATRVSFKLGLTGPSISVQTNCSTSLVAVHLACQSLLNFECDMALAGGVSLQCLRREGYEYLPGGIASPDGHCRPFDADARGTVAGSGVAAVVLKRLADAYRDGDHVEAVIRGTALNNDGAAKVGYTAPGLRAQVDVVTAALATAGLSAAEIGFVEAHGTGTVLGDAVEISALTDVFAAAGARPGCCALGSIKSNVGHLDAASGVTGLIKAVLCLKHRRLVPTVNFTRPNPQLADPCSPFRVCTAVTPWISQQRRYAAVSSFGVGGTNAHAILEEPAQPVTAPSAAAPLAFPLSALSEEALRRMSESLAAFVCGRSEISLQDISHTLQVGRRRFPYRRCIVAETAAELSAALERLEPKAFTIDEHSDRAVVLVFAGRRHAMRASVTEPAGIDTAFADDLARCHDVLAPFGIDMRALLCGLGQEPEPGAAIADAAWVALQFCIARSLLRSGVRPIGVLAEGIGEYAALCIADACTIEEALRSIVADCMTGSELGNIEWRVPRLKCASFAAGVVRERTRLQAASNATSEPCNDGRLLELLRDWPEAREALVVGVGAHVDTMADAVQRRERIACAAHAEAPFDRRSLLTTLAALWAQGVDVQWPASVVGARRAALPTYPFERARHWIAPQSQEMPADTAELSRLPRSRWFNIPSWQTSMQALPLPAEPRTPHPYVVFQDEDGFAEQLIRQMRGLRCCVVAVGRGDVYQQRDPHSFAIRQDSCEDHERLLAALRERFGAIAAVVHCGAVCAGGRDDSLGFFDRSQRRGYLSLLALLQGYARLAGPPPLSIMVVTNGSHAVAGHWCAYPEHATLGALCKIASQELAPVRCTLLDLPAPDCVRPLREQYSRYVERAIAEICAPQIDQLVAYRGDSRLVQSYRQITLAPSADAPGFRQGGTYIITGGLGRIGRRLAQRLAQKYRANLVLVGRPGSDGDVDAFARSIAEAGGQALIARADLCDEKAVRDLLHHAEGRFGAVHAVMHLAAELRHESRRRRLQELSAEDLAAQRAAKVGGFYALERALRGRSLDFALVFSSNSALLGGFGYGAYAAVNAFLDQAVTQAASLHAFPWLVVNWDGWLLDDAGRELGAPVLRRLEKYMVHVEEGLDALEDVVRAKPAQQVVISCSDLSARLQRWAGHSPQLAAPAGVRAGRNPQRVRPRTQLEATIAGVWQEVLGIEQVGVDEDFMALGGDSLIALRVLSRLRPIFGVSIPPQSLIGSRITVESLAVAVVAALLAADRPNDSQEDEAATAPVVVQSAAAATHG
jgi:acyl transferase domain-containing protein